MAPLQKAPWATSPTQWVAVLARLPTKQLGSSLGGDNNKLHLLRTVPEVVHVHDLICPVTEATLVPTTTAALKEGWASAKTCLEFPHSPPPHRPVV